MELHYNSQIDNSEISIEPYEFINLAAILRQCRLTICEAYVSGRHEAALAALAAASIRLYRHVENGSLIGSVACQTLWDVADNLTLTAALGEDAVSEAIASGPQFYDRLGAAQ